MQSARSRTTKIAALLLIALLSAQTCAEQNGTASEFFPIASSAANLAALGSDSFADSAIEQAAMWQPTPALTTPPGVVRPTVPGATPRRAPYATIRLASVPNMFGDTKEGGCGGLFISGSLAASVEHPTYACSRLNISENNSPIVRDRAYYSFRHFTNATKIDAFSYSPAGRAASLDIERHIFGMEKLISDSTSLEVRVPINKQLTSTLNFLQTDSDSTTDGSNINFDEVFAQQPTRIGNLDVILKHRMIETDTFYLSAGMGFNLPTAQSIRVRGTVNDPNYQIYDPLLTRAQNIAQGPTNGPIPTGDAIFLKFDGFYSNQTVNMLPFVAFVWTPTENWFSQGFAQLDVPLNESTGFLGLRLDAQNNPIFDNLATPAQARLAEQTVLRLNYGFGRWLYRNEEGRLNALAAVIEFHYTTTLNDSDIVSFPLLAPNQIGLPVLNRGLSLGFGNLENRIDIVNTVVGFPMYLGMTSIYNGFAFPISPSHGFDMEYILSINRRF